MSCYVYRSVRKVDTYVYLRLDDGGASLPPAVRSMLGELHRVMALELHPKRRLAREDVSVVLSNLASSGFHVQFPPNTVIPRS